MSRKKLREHNINRDWCKGCGICVAMCPKDVLVLDGDEKALASHPEKCIACRQCEKMCPDLAIEVIIEDAHGKEE